MRKQILFLLIFNSLSLISYSQSTLQLLDKNILLADELKFSKPDSSLTLALWSLNKSKELKLYARHIRSATILGHIYTDKGNIDKANEVLVSAIKIGTENNLLSEVADAEVYFGNLFLKIGLYHKALVKYKIAEKHFNHSNFTEGIIKTITNSAICQMYLNNYDTAIASFHNALTIAKKSNKTKEQGLINNNLGRLHLRKGEYNRAKSYLDRSIKLLEKTNKLNSIYRSKLLLAEIDFHEKKIKQSLKSATIVCEKSLELKDYQNVVRAKKLIAEAYEKLGNTQSAIKHYQESISIGKEFKIRQNLLDVQISFLKWLLKNEDYNKADSLIIDIDKLANFINSAESLIKIYQLKALRFEQIGAFKKAYLVSQNRERIIDSINQFEKHELIERLEQEYDNEKREVELTLQILRDQQAIIWLTLTILVILIISSLIIINYRGKQKNIKLKLQRNEAILREKNIEVKKNKEIASVKAEIKGQESERKRLARELHDGLGGTLTSIKWNISQLKVQQQDFDILNKVVNRLDNACQEIRTISHHLMPKIFEDKIFAEIIEEYLAEVENNSEFDIYFEIYPEEEFDILDNLLKNDIYRLLQELCNNTIKHASANLLNIQLIMHPEFINIIVEDDGCGFDQNQMIGGIGLQNIKSRLILHNGQINIDTHVNRGTLININIPVNKD